MRSAELANEMKHYFVQVNGPTFKFRVLVNAGENVPVSLIEHAVLQAVQAQQQAAATGAPIGGGVATGTAPVWGRN